MSIEAPTPATTTAPATTQSTQSTTAQSTTAQKTSDNKTQSVKEDSKSFKEELNTTKTQEKTQNTEVKNQQTTQLTPDAKQEALLIQIQQNVVQQNVVQQNTAQKNIANNLNKDLSKDLTKKTNIEEKNLDVSETLIELNATLNNIKSTTHQKTQEIHSQKDSFAKDDFCANIKMDNQDISFFLNLVQNQQMTTNIAQNGTQQASTINDIKTETTQQSVQVSNVLLNSLNEAMKTNKPFRIDFGNDVAVIMRVDKEGVLSANFIPGNAAVEAYLKNNIEGLKQSFNEQNLAYNELSYSKQQQKQEQKEQNKKENRDE